MKELTYLLILVLGYFLYTNIVRKRLFLVNVVSDQGGSFLVRNLRDKQEASNRLATLSQHLQTICDECKRREEDEDSPRRAGIERLTNKFKHREITENIPGSSHVAYSVNKGDELSICIRDKETEEFIDENTVIFVAVHQCILPSAANSKNTNCEGPNHEPSDLRSRNPFGGCWCTFAPVLGALQRSCTDTDRPSS